MRSINGSITHPCLGRSRFRRLPIEKEHCIDSFVLDADREHSTGCFGGRVKVSLRVAEKISWYLAEEQARDENRVNESYIDNLAHDMLDKLYGISRSWITTPKKIRLKMGLALKRKEYLNGEWRGSRNGDEFRIFMRYEDFVGSPYDPNILIIGNILSETERISDLGRLKNPTTNKWDPAVKIEYYQRCIGNAYFASIAGNNGEVCCGSSLDEVIEAAAPKDGRPPTLRLRYAGESVFDVNYTTATSVFVG